MKINYIRINENLWDWWWMVEWFKRRHADSKFICQLDSDILVPPHRLKACLLTLEKSESKIAMLKRAWVTEKWVLPTKDEKEIRDWWAYIKYWTVERPVWCYVCDIDVFEKTLWVEWPKSKYELAKNAELKVVKLLNFPCKILDIEPHIYSEEHWEQIPLNYYKYIRKTMKSFI